jgi:acyl-coenzyme A thioesterase PaaI-like protein
MNKLSKTLAKLDFLPENLKMKTISFVLGNTVKYVGTSGVNFEKITSKELIVTLENRSKVRNHIGQIHAAATTLLAETATGIIVGVNIPDNKIPLMKTLKVDFVRRSKGKQTAISSLTDEQINLIKTTDKGETLVAVKVTDETGAEVVKAEMLWAWIPKK